MVYNKGVKIELIPVSDGALEHVLKAFTTSRKRGIEASCILLSA